MTEIQNWETPALVASILSEENIPYQFVGQCSLILQGVEMEADTGVTAEIQWDLMDKAYTQFARFNPGVMKKDRNTATFSFNMDDENIKIECRFNTTIRTNPYRISTDFQGTEIWCQSLYYYLFDIQTDKEIKKKIHSFLLHKQNDMTIQNSQAWNQDNYQALIKRFGEPADAAVKIAENPQWRLHPFYKYLGDVEDKKILHLMGSNGVKGTALALLGAEVTIVDFSKENEKFAIELSKNAGVELKYILSDVLHLPEEVQLDCYDIVLMELGVLHYLLDLQPLFEIIKARLIPGGKFVLHEFHPISTKLITSDGKKHRVKGNYFEPSIEINDVAFSKHMSESIQTELKKVAQRKWTIGEIITSAGQSGLHITQLEEEPNHKVHDIGLPKTFTLVAEKRNG